MSDIKLCQDCQYLEHNLICVAHENGISPVNGKPKAMFASERRGMDASVIFSETEKCGLEGKHFKGKVPKKTVWWKFWCVNK